MTISTNRPGRRETDVSDWGASFKKKVSAFFKDSHHLIPGIQLGAIKNSLERQIIKWKLTLHFL